MFFDQRKETLFALLIALLWYLNFYEERIAWIVVMMVYSEIPVLKVTFSF